MAMACMAVTICGCSRQAQKTQNITTVAGNGNAGYSGDGGPAISAELGFGTNSITVDPLGNLYIADTENKRIRKVDTSGRITTVAGNGKEGDSGDGGPATGAELRGPIGVAVLSAGDLVIADGKLTIRYVIAKTGTIHALAGFSPAMLASNGDGGPLNKSRFYEITNLAHDGADDIYIEDSGTIRKASASTGIITTVSGGGAGFARETEPEGDRCLTDKAMFGPSAMAVDKAGNAYIASGYRICKVDAHTGIITTVAGNGTGGYSGDGGAATSASFFRPDGLAVDSDGNLYISDMLGQCVRKVTASTGVITTVAGSDWSGYPNGGYSGDGGPATSAKLNKPGGLAVDSAGNLYIADVGNHRIRKVEHREAVPAESRSHSPIVLPVATGLAGLALAGLAVAVWVWRRKVAVQKP
jgi:internalin A